MLNDGTDSKAGELCDLRKSVIPLRGKLKLIGVLIVVNCFTMLTKVKVCFSQHRGDAGSCFGNKKHVP